MIQVLIYGDRLDDGTRELLGSLKSKKNIRMTSRMYKNIVHELNFLRDISTRHKYAEAIIFSGDKIVFSIETELFDFDDKNMIFTYINHITVRHYNR